MTIETLVFDLGVVLIDIDNQRPIKHLSTLGVTNAAQLFTRSNQYCVDYETGKISSSIFLDAVLDNIKTTKPINASQVEAAWRSIIVNIPEWKVIAIKQLRYKYNIIALSNTNALHVDEINKVYQQKNLGQDFFALFDTVYLSHEMQLKKPDLAIYQQVTTTQQLNPEAILFLDDLVENTQAASQLEWQTSIVTDTVSFNKTINRL